MWTLCTSWHVSQEGNEKPALVPWSLICVLSGRPFRSNPVVFISANHTLPPLCGCSWPAPERSLRKFGVLCSFLSSEVSAEGQHKQCHRARTAAPFVLVSEGFYAHEFFPKTYHAVRSACATDAEVSSCETKELLVMSLTGMICDVFLL